MPNTHWKYDLPRKAIPIYKSFGGGVKLYPYHGDFDKGAFTLSGYSQFTPERFSRGTLSKNMNE